MQWPKNRWGKVTVVAWVFAVGYVLAILTTQLLWGKTWPDWLRDITSAGLAVALMIISISYGGNLTNFYDKLTGFGISEVRVDRRGADPMQTKNWMDRIRGSEQVTIVGTLSQGWFVVAKDNLKELLHTSIQPKRLYVCLLDPFGKVWRSRIESGEPAHGRFLRDATQVFRNLCDLMIAQSDQSDRISVHLYDTEPLSCVVARGAIYLGLYLPRTERKEVPEFTISGGSFLGDKLYTESVNRLKDSAPSVNADGLRKYIKTMEKHLTTSREAYWSDPEVFCDFCKEHRDLPSEFSRRYPTFSKRSRMIPAKEHFFLIPSLGQIVNDHALIVSNIHVTASAQLKKEAIAELATLLTKLTDKAAASGKAHLAFEHGIPFEGTSYGGCGICHCHIHSLPIEKADYNPTEDLDAFLKAKGCKFDRQPLASWEDIHKCAKQSYLSLQVGKGAPVVFVFDFGQRVESQLMRQFLAENCPSAKSEWDWRAATDNADMLLKTCEELTSVLSERAVSTASA